MKNKKRNSVKAFASYYKPHIKPFIADILCALGLVACGIIYPAIARKIFNEYVFDDTFTRALIAGAIMLAVFILKAVFRYMVDYYGHVFGVKMQKQMRKELFDKLERLPVSYFDETPTGSIISRITNDLFEVSELAHHGPEDAFVSILSFIGAVVMIMGINPYLALVIGLVLPIMLLIVARMRIKMIAAFKKRRETTAEINSEVESSISGIRVSKAYCAAQTESKKFEKSNERYCESRIGVLKVMGRFNSVMQFCIDILYLLCVVMGGFMCFKGTISAGDLTALVLYVAMLVSPIRTFVVLIEQIEDGIVGFERFLDITQLQSEYEPTNPVKINGLSGDIEYKNVCFTYKGQGNAAHVVENLSFTVKEGTSVALVGASGAGKTTICNLLPRFYLPDSGKITIGGVDISTLKTDDLRKFIGVVQQETFLFSGTVKENISYGNPTATDEDIVAAAKLAGVHKFVEGQTDGYDTYIGEHGVKLSGGQRQRISIARAFLKNPPILILDEATSSLDTVTEREIQQALETLKVGRTTITVAHRLSTVKKADEIFVIDGKGIAEKGTHKELMAQNGIYASLYTAAE